MLILVTHNYLIFKRKEVWFYAGETVKIGGYCAFSAAKKIPLKHVQNIHKYNSAKIDLLKDDDELLKAVHPRLRYDLQLAGKINFEFLVIHSPSEKECEDAMTSFNRFAEGKPIDLMLRSWILAAAKSGKLYITKIIYENQEVVSHIFLSDEDEIVNTHSFYNLTFDNPAVSKFANKMLHWKEIIHFKNKGFKTYSFGPVNPELKGITQFKMNFGSEITESFRFIKTSYFLYKLINIFKSLRKK